MNLINQHLKLLTRKWKLGLVIFVFASLYLLLPLFFSIKYQVNPWFYALSAPIVVATSLAFFMAQTQKELMCNLSSFLLPHFSQTLWRIHAITLAALGIGTFFLGYFLPLLEPVSTHAWLPALNLSLLTMACYAVTLLVVFKFRYSSWLSTALFFPYFYYIHLGKHADPQLYRSFLENFGLFAVCIFLTAGIFKLLTSFNLSRQLAEQPFLPVLQMHRTDKVQQFKNRNSAYKISRNQSARPMKEIMDACLEKACRARYAGKESRAVFWDTNYLALTTGIPRGFLGIWNYAFFIAPFILAIGYADSMRSCDSSMVGWYSAFPFMFATLPIMGFHYLRVGPLGFPRNRVATEKAGYVFTGWVVLAVILFSVLMFAAMHFLGAVMPEYETATRVWSFHPPSKFHTPFLPLLIFPVVLLIYLLWPRSSSQMILGGAGMQVFLFFNFMISNDEQGWLTVVVIGLSAGAWIILPFLWRRELRRSG